MTHYAVRARVGAQGVSLQVVRQGNSAEARDSGANAIYDGPPGLGVGAFLPAGCPFIHAIGDGNGYTDGTGRERPVRTDLIPEVSPAPPVPVVGLGIDSLR